MRIRLVGIDCATKDTKIGVAFGDCSDNQLAVLDAFVCTKERSAVDRISSWLQERREPALLAIDAPLGWPRALSRILTKHRAGGELSAEPHEMFRRATDRFIKERTCKTPLDVGADRIARTAHAALCLLRDIRHELKAEIPLAWEWPPKGKVSAIEVYPAATLVAHGLRSSGYKKATHEVQRIGIIEELSSIAYIPFDLSRRMMAKADVLDAVICLLAAKDFLSGEAIPPPDGDLAKFEGWIWVREVT